MNNMHEHVDKVRTVCTYINIRNTIIKYFRQTESKYSNSTVWKIKCILTVIYNKL